MKKTTKTNPKAPPVRRPKKAAKSGSTQATAKDFEREGMGIAPKE